jgi:hypothetical protein
MATGAAWLKDRNSQGEREEQNILTGKEKRKTYLTLAGLLMEGVSNDRRLFSARFRNLIDAFGRDIGAR